MRTKFDAFVEEKWPQDIRVSWTRMRAEFDKRGFVVKPLQRRLARWLGFMCRRYRVLTNAEHADRDGAEFHLTPAAEVPIVYGFDFGWGDWKGAVFPERQLTYRSYACPGYWGAVAYAHIPGTMHMIPLHDAIRDSAPIVKVDLPEQLFRMPLYGTVGQCVYAFASEIPGLVEKQLEREEKRLCEKEREIAETRAALTAYADCVRALAQV